MNKNIKISIFTALLMIISPFGFAQNKESQTGKASYYADKFQGRKTSSGEEYDQNKLTAAHNTLPFNTKVKVTNLKNNKSVIVRINDRGPFSKGRIIDLSKAAAEKIDLIRDGVAEVRIQIITENENNTKPEPDPEPSTENDNTRTDEKIITKSNPLATGKVYDISGKIVHPKGYGIQIISVSNKDNLIEELGKVNNKFKNIYIEAAKVKSSVVYRILIGSYQSSGEAKKDLPKVKKQGYKAFVKKYT
jgi:rare lipoprotein A